MSGLLNKRLSNSKWVYVYNTAAHALLAAALAIGIATCISGDIFLFDTTNCVRKNSPNAFTEFSRGQGILFNCLTDQSSLASLDSATKSQIFFQKCKLKEFTIDTKLKTLTDKGSLIMKVRMAAVVLFVFGLVIGFCILIQIPFSLCSIPRCYEELDLLISYARYLCSCGIILLLSSILLLAGLVVNLFDFYLGTIHSAAELTDIYSSLNDSKDPVKIHQRAGNIGIAFGLLFTTIYLLLGLIALVTENSIRIDVDRANISKELGILPTSLTRARGMISECPVSPNEISTFKIDKTKLNYRNCLNILFPDESVHSEGGMLFRDLRLTYIVLLALGLFLGCVIQIICPIIYVSLRASDQFHNINQCIGKFLFAQALLSSIAALCIAAGAVVYLHAVIFEFFIEAPDDELIYRSMAKELRDRSTYSLMPSCCLIWICLLCALASSSFFFIASYNFAVEIITLNNQVLDTNIYSYAMDEGEIRIKEHYRTE